MRFSSTVPSCAARRVAARRLCLDPASSRPQRWTAAKKALAVLIRTGPNKAKFSIDASAEAQRKIDGQQVADVTLTYIQNNTRKLASCFYKRGTKVAVGYVFEGRRLNGRGHGSGQPPALIRGGCEGGSLTGIWAGLRKTACAAALKPVPRYGAEAPTRDEGICNGAAFLTTPLILSSRRRRRIEGRRSGQTTPLRLSSAMAASSRSSNSPSTSSVCSPTVGAGRVYSGRRLRQFERAGDVGLGFAGRAVGNLDDHVARPDLRIVEGLADAVDRRDRHAERRQAVQPMAARVPAGQRRDRLDAGGPGCAPAARWL